MQPHGHTLSDSLEKNGLGTYLAFYQPDARYLQRVCFRLLLGCGPRRAEFLHLNMEDLRRRKRLLKMFAEIEGKGNRIRIVIGPAAVRAGIDEGLKAAGIDTGRMFRPVNKADVLAGTEMRDEKAVWRLAMRYAAQTEMGRLAPHNLRRTCAKLCRKAVGN